MLLAGALLFTLTLGLLAAPPAAEAQQAPKMPRVGLLSVTPLLSDRIEAFRQGLRDLGYVEGQNITIEYRSAEGKHDRLSELAAELVRLKVNVIVVAATPAALMAKDATKTIPIVMVGVVDPVRSGLIGSLARPGGNITGLTLLAGMEMVGKHLELLKEVVTNVSRVAVLWNPDNQSNVLQLREVEIAGRSLGVQFQILAARSPEEFDRAFAAMTGERADALIVFADPMLLFHRTRLADLAAKSRLPAIYALKAHAEVGGLISYGANSPDIIRRAATYVDKILKGTKPADLPVEQPTRFELVINMKTAKALGLTIPPSVLIRADQVIQ